MFGYSRGELLGQSIVMLVPAAAVETLADMRERVLGDDAAASEPTPLPAHRRDGTEFPIEIVLSAIQDGGETLLCGSIRDISERTRAELERAWLAAIVESSSDAIVGLGPDGTIQSWNGGAERLYGYAAADAIGRSVSILFTPEQSAEREAELARVLAGETDCVREETIDLRADGTRVPVALTRSPIRDHAGRTIGVSRIAQDITERKHLEQELRWGSEHDPVTGLYNRRRFGEELAREVTRAARYPESAGALLLADLDNFKYVNDTMGHRAGDRLIMGVAEVLAGRIRTTDFLARIGGDEFAVLLPHTRLDAAWLVARSLTDAVRDYGVVIDGQRLRTTVSIGVAPLGGGITGEDSLAIADMAMYEAKRHGRDRAITFSRQPEHMRDQLGWAERLRDALAHEHLTLYAQPIVDVATGACVRHELLLRLREPDGGIVPPKAFLPAAERFGLINDIDRWVVGAAIDLIAAADATTTYAINVSGLSLGDGGLLTLIADGLARAGLDPRRLVVEVAEADAVTDLNVAREFMLGLREIGCLSALDNFGSGFSSFAAVRELPLDLLKIDGELIRPLPGAEHDRVLVKAIVDVARALGMRTVGEHVGSAEALAALRDAGVDLAQGYLLGRPRPVAGIGAATRPG
jgi:diguanylate cyclase (GGDEF)-like protein/PAS domain S-box-containing protein